MPRENTNAADGVMDALLRISGGEPVYVGPDVASNGVDGLTGLSLCKRMLIET